MLIGTVFAWRWLAQLERRLISTLTGVSIPSPYRPDPRGAGWSRKLRSRLADPATWKDLLFLLLQLPLGIASFTVAVVVLGLAASWIAAPAFYWSIPDGIELGFANVDTLGEAFALVPLGLVLAFVGIPALGQLGRGYGALASLLLTSNPDPELTAQVTELEGARSRIIAAADEERRRIERDLHDGAQQRLVALSLTLRMAETRAEKGDPEAAELIRNAGEEAGLALKELRDLARGIHPAILTNRGLAAALDDLAARATVPVEVTEAPSERLPDQVEAAAYFVVSECLANVGKHAQASAATVSVRTEGAGLAVEVADDGRGGADTENGSGIQGLRDRVGALGGGLEIESPETGGTRVRATIPLAVPVDIDEEPTLVRPVVLATTTRRRCRPDAPVAGACGSGIVGAVAGVLVLVWALTGTDKPWIVWPLLGLGLVAALDAWAVLGNRPLRESDVAAADGARPEAIRSLEAAAAHSPRGRRARRPEPLPGRRLDRLGRGLLLAGVADPRLRGGARPQVAALGGPGARAARGRPLDPLTGLLRFPEGSRRARRCGRGCSRRARAGRPRRGCAGRPRPPRRARGGAGPRRTAPAGRGRRAARPPIAKPVAARTSSALACRISATSRMSASLLVSIRCRPEATQTTGSPSATNTIDFAISDSSQPTAVAASLTVRVDSASRCTRTWMPRSRAHSARRSLTRARPPARSRRARRRRRRPAPRSSSAAPRRSRRDPTSRRSRRRGRS